MTSNLRGAIVLLAALAAAALTARLGVWQLDRAAQKTALQRQVDGQRALPPLQAADITRDPAGSAAQLQRAIVLDGSWRGDLSVYLENRQMNGRPGFYVLTPLLLADGSAVLVQRGWLPRDQADRTHLTAPPPPAGVVQVAGRIVQGPARLFDFAGAASGPIRQNLDLGAFARESGLPLRPFMVVQNDSLPVVEDGLLRQWPQPAADVHKHYGYAFQWFAMSALIIGLYAWFRIIRPARAECDAAST